MLHFYCIKVGGGAEIKFHKSLTDLFEAGNSLWKVVDTGEVKLSIIAGIFQFYMFPVSHINRHG